MLCSCDKIVPGMLMAVAHLDLPTIFMTGGIMVPPKIGNKYLVNYNMVTTQKVPKVPIFQK